MRILSIIIPTFNRSEYLFNLLTDLINQDIKHISDFIVKYFIIVDGSTDETLNMLSDNFPFAIVLKGDGSWWFTRCINEGLKQAKSIKSDYFLLLNDDIRLPNTYLEKLILGYEMLNINSLMGSLSIKVTKPNYILFSGIKSYNKLICKYERLSLIHI